MRSRLVAAAVAVAALSALAPAAQAAVHAPVAAVQSSAACTYKRDGNVWRCVTPGAYCPKAARAKYGYAKVTKKRYKCSQYTAATWRWKRA